MTTDDVRDTFGSDTVSHINADKLHWAVRIHGPGIGHRVVDALKLSEVLAAIARATRWIGNGLYPTQGAVPGISLARAGSSAVVHLNPGLREEPVIGLDDEDDAYVSVEGGRYLARLLAAANDWDTLSEGLAPLGARAVQTYTTVLDELAEMELGLNALVYAPLDPARGDLVPAQVDLTVDQAVEDLRFLRHEPKMVRSVEMVIGTLFAQNAHTRRFAIKPDTGPQLTGEYTAEVEPLLGSVWNRRVVATIETVAPEYEWLPRAGRTRRVLHAVERAAD
ncbi:hypothetical protein VSS74_16430 [Conexibacter stalactiti]|uniref:Uncharacterized protein n=1 Tax=Conexibacter stalactiti TaxID=1940611 RepID=A0ABU4HRI2_9ACTN|nr:hypothetical protein [Conexibacter stalactiti]MDW5595937.1 hypothetical protein [Conexibacter stalactiti]MEC5036579.1 hypothetical protein [Conexibacter stalactiti]